MSELKLSKKSEKFLEDLRVYLFANRKSFDATEDIINELATHLHEAEANGKSIDRIIGSSPKEYMEMISNEVEEDRPAWMKYIFLIIVGAFAFIAFPDLTKGHLSYSLLEIIGHVIIGLLLMAIVLFYFRYTATTKHSIKTQGILLVLVTLLPTGLFIGLIYLNRAIETPIIDFGSTGTLLFIGIMTVIIIGISIWARTWMLILVLSLLTLPEYLLTFTPLSEVMQMFIGMVITYGGLFIYLLFLNKSLKNEEATS